MKRTKSLLRQIGEVCHHPELKEVIQAGLKGETLAEIVGNIASAAHQHQMECNFSDGEITVGADNARIHIDRKRHADYEVTFWDDSEEDCVKCP